MSWYIGAESWHGTYAADGETLHAELDSELEEIASMPRQIEGVLVGATLRQRDDGYKISLRSGEEIDSAAICGKLGGGGHRCAAGCFVKGNLEHAKKEIRAVGGETLGYGEEKC